MQSVLKHRIYMTQLFQPIYHRAVTTMEANEEHEHLKQSLLKKLTMLRPLSQQHTLYFMTAFFTFTIALLVYVE